MAMPKSSLSKQERQRLRYAERMSNFRSGKINFDEISEQRRKREAEARERLERELYAEIRRRLIPTGERVRA